MLDKAGARIDLGGIAKGYAVDVCYRKLRDIGARDVMINMGGNIRCMGRGRRHRPWTIGVQSPFERDRLVGTVALSDGMALATSGHYEKYVVIEGRRYAHVIDPRTGRPVQGMAGVTVLGSTAAEADALSTALFVAGLRESEAILANTPGASALFIPDEQPMRILVTPGMKEHFTPHPDIASCVRVTGKDEGTQGSTGRESPP
jgi:thiamine biosynthesis lipoprotein